MPPTETPQAQVLHPFSFPHLSPRFGWGTKQGGGGWTLLRQPPLHDHPPSHDARPGFSSKGLIAGAGVRTRRCIAGGA